MTVKFYIRSTTSYTVEPGAATCIAQHELDGTLDAIELLEGNVVVASFEASEGPQYAESREQYDLIEAAAQVANVLLYPAEDDSLVLMYREER